MMASTFDGEALNAARKATDLIRRHNLSWADVLAPALAPQPEPDIEMPAHVVSARWALHMNLVAKALSEWERGFLADIIKADRLSEKQRKKLEEAVEKVAVALEKARD
jgi:hypothetical protein